MNKFLRNNNVLKIFLCVLILLGMLPFHTVSSDEEEEIDYFSLGGKLNGEFAVDLTDEDAAYSAVVYNNANGLPTSEANDIVMSSEGFIWIGSYAGLIRYDGSHFEQMGYSSIMCLFVDSENRLWVGTNDYGMYVQDGNDIQEWDHFNGLKSLSVRDIAQGPGNLFYAATTEGLAIIDSDFRLTYVEDPRLSDAFIYQIQAGTDGKIYGVTGTGDIFSLKDGKLDAYQSFTDTPLKGANCILPDPENPGMIYAVMMDDNMYHGSFEDRFLNSTSIDVSSLSQINAIEYLYGNVFVFARNEIAILNKNGFFNLKDLPIQHSVCHVMTDYSGNIWFTSLREGVMKVVKNRFTDLSYQYDLEAATVNSTCLYEDQLFIGTDDGLVVVDQDENIVNRVPLNEMAEASSSGEETDNLIEVLSDVRIRSIIRDSKDRLWFSTWRDQGLLRYDHGDLKIFNEANGLPSESVRAVYECDDGRILVAGNYGASVIVDDEVVAVYGLDEGIANTTILTVTQGEGNDILIGTDGAGIYIASDDGIRHIDHDGGLISDVVMKIKRSKDNDVYWLVTGNTLGYLTKDYELNVIQGFPFGNNLDIVENDKGELWVFSSDGIYIVKKDEMLTDSFAAPLHFGIADGLPYITTANSYSELTDDGNLYISGLGGVAKVNINAPFEDVSELRFSIPYVEADSYFIYPDEDGNFTIPADTFWLTIYVYVYNYSLIEPMATCRLIGFENYDNYGSPDLLFPIYYTNVPGGTYQFKLELSYALSDSMIGTTVNITKEKKIYEQAWFYVYAGLDFLILLFAIGSIAGFRQEKRLEKKHKEETEKQRISNELKLANNIQRSALPHIFPPFPDRNEFELYASMDPAKEVGGDFYDFFFIDDDNLCMVIADVSGKGIPGALFMMISKAILNNAALFGGSPSNIMTMVNDSLCSSNTAEMFVTVWLGVLEISTGRIKATNAGHEYPIIRKPGGNFEIMKDNHDLAMGVMPGYVYREYEFNLEPGSKLFLYTDGVPEATDSKNRLFGMDRLVDALNKDPDADPKQTMLNVREAVDDFVKEAEQFDDLTMMCIEYKGPEKDQK